MLNTTIETNINGNASTATKLQTPRTINGVAFDGSSDIIIEDSTKLPLTGGTMAGGIVIRHIDGSSNGVESDSNLYLNYGGQPVCFGNVGHNINSNGAQYTGTANTAWTVHTDGVEYNPDEACQNRSYRTGIVNTPFNYSNFFSAHNADTYAQIMVNYYTGVMASRGASGGDNAVWTPWITAAPIPTNDAKLGQVITWANVTMYSLPTGGSWLILCSICYTADHQYCAWNAVGTILAGGTAIISSGSDYVAGVAWRIA